MHAHQTDMRHDPHERLPAEAPPNVRLVPNETDAKNDHVTTPSITHTRTGDLKITLNDR